MPTVVNNAQSTLTFADSVSRLIGLNGIVTGSPAVRFTNGADIEAYLTVQGTIAGEFFGIRTDGAERIVVTQSGIVTGDTGSSGGFDLLGPNNFISNSGTIFGTDFAFFRWRWREQRNREHKYRCDSVRR